MKQFRICMIGASHITSFELGWQKISYAYPFVDITAVPGGGSFYSEFFCNFNKNTLGVTNAITKSRIIQNYGNDGELNLDDFDLCLVTGGVKWWSGIDRRLYSQQVFDAALFYQIESSLAYPLLNVIRQISKIPIYLTLAPFAPKRDGSFGRSSVGFSEEICRINDGLFGGKNIEILPQIEESMIGGLLQSKLEFAVGERRHPAKPIEGQETTILYDLVHLNPAFGARFLAQILERQGIFPTEDITEFPIATGCMTLAEKESLSI